MSTAATAPQTEQSQAAADDREPALPLRSDTFLGVCEAIGQDLRINPAWLRITFAGLLFWNPEVIVACYFALGIVVAATRYAFPVARKPAALVDDQTPVREAAAVEQVEEKELLAA